MMRPNVATYQTVRRNRSLTSRCIPGGDELASLTEAGSGTSHSLDQLVWEICVDLGGQPPDQHFQHAGERSGILIPDVRRDCGAIDDLAVVQHKKLEQRELLGGQLDGF